MTPDEARAFVDGVLQEAAGEWAEWLEWSKVNRPTFLDGTKPTDAEVEEHLRGIKPGWPNLCIEKTSAYATCLRRDSIRASKALYPLDEESAEAVSKELERRAKSND